MNNKIDSLGVNLINLWSVFSEERKKYFALLVLLVIICSCAEVLVIGSILPFFSLIANTDTTIIKSPIQFVFNYFPIESFQNPKLTISIFFALTIVVAASLRTLLSWATTKFSFSLGAELGSRIYKAVLNQPYHIHINRESSVVIDGITNQINGIVYGTTMPFLQLISAICLTFFIFIALLLVDFKITLISFLCFVLLYIIVALITKTKLKKNSLFCAYESHRVLKSLQEGIGGIREILIDGTQRLHAEVHSKVDLSYRNAQASTLFISLAPRYPVEAFAIVVMTVLAYTLSSDTDVASTAIPKLAVMALGAQRILPLLQSTFGAWSALKGAQYSVTETIELLTSSENCPIANVTLKEIPFQSSVELANVSFKYKDDQSFILQNIYLSIRKGSRIGLVGTTGSGKSTLLDLIMGLLQPTTGSLIVDGKHEINQSNAMSWCRHVAHVPQNIFLLDRSIAENIAMSDIEKKIDFERVIVCSKRASLDEFVSTLPMQYDTLVGERGVRLSGGQRQRIGIARALYKHADLLILDEATNALDEMTEGAVMLELDKLGREVTIVMVSHRSNTLNNCDFVYKLTQGQIELIKT